MPKQRENLIDQLKNKTESLHQTLEREPFFHALMEEKLPLASYVAWLKVLAIIHNVVEHLVIHSKDETLNVIWVDEMSKRALLDDDLGYFDDHDIPEPSRATAAAVDVVALIRKWYDTNPHSLVGCLYVLEASMLGSNTKRENWFALVHSHIDTPSQAD